MHSPASASYRRLRHSRLIAWVVSAIGALELHGSAVATADALIIDVGNPSGDISCNQSSSGSLVQCHLSIAGGAIFADASASASFGNLFVQTDTGEVATASMWQPTNYVLASFDQIMSLSGAGTMTSTWQIDWSEAYGLGPGSFSAFGQDVPFWDGASSGSKTVDITSAYSGSIDLTAMAI